MTQEYKNPGCLNKKSQKKGERREKQSLGSSFELMLLFSNQSEFSSTSPIKEKKFHLDSLYF